MKFFLRLSSLIDRLNTVVGTSVTWLTLIGVLVSAINAVVRKVYGISSNQWLELQCICSVQFSCWRLVIPSL